MPGSGRFTACLLLNSILGVKPTSIPFNGTGPALTALISGQVDYMCDQIVNVVSQVQGGTIKAYAIATAERNPSLPNVPTTREAGMPEFQVSAWNALFAPKGTPQPIVDKLHATLVKVIATPELQRDVIDAGSVAQSSTPAELMSRLRAEYESLAKLAKMAGVAAD